MRRDYIENMEGVERRFITTRVEKVKVEERNEEKKGALIRGIAVKVNSEADLGWFREIIMPGALDKVLADTDKLDCRCLFNHDANLILARANKNTDTLKLMLNADGDLEFEYETPNRSYALDLADSIASGDVSQCSFAFRIAKDGQRWIFDEEDPNNDLREINEISELLDVSPVTYPAYPDTQVGERSHKAARSENPRYSKNKSRAVLRKAQFKFNKNKANCLWNL